MPRRKKMFKPEDLKFSGTNLDESLAIGIRRRIREQVPSIVKHLKVEKGWTNEISESEYHDLLKFYQSGSWVNHQGPYKIAGFIDSSNTRNAATDNSHSSLTHAMTIIEELKDIENTLLEALYTAWLTVREHDNLPVEAVVKRNLEDLSRIEDSDLVRTVNLFDIETSAYIYFHLYAEDSINAETEVGTYRCAVEKAIEAIPPPSRGRQSGSHPVALARLADELGELYFMKSSRKPGRTWDEYRGEESGPFLRYLDCVLEIVPEWLLVRVHGRKSSRLSIVEYMTRVATKRWRHKDLSDIGRLGI